MSQIVWTQAAIANLNRHYDFIKLNDVDVATRAVQAIVSSRTFNNWCDRSFSGMRS